MWPVDSPRDRPTLQSVALIDLDPELAGYLEQRLRRHWPMVRVQRLTDDSERRSDAAQLSIRDAEPHIPIDRLTLWLADIDRSQRPVRLSQHLWKSPTPLTGGRLLRIVEGMLRNAPGLPLAAPD